MKNNLITFALIILSATAGINVAEAQRSGSSFKGYITYNVSFPGSGSDAAQSAMLPNKMKVALNGNKARLELFMSGVSQIILSDADLQTTIVLADVMGQKLAVKPNRAERMTAPKEPVVTVTAETRDIAGYKCKKAEIHYGDEKSKESPVIVWFSEDIGNNRLFYDNEYRTLPGIPMEFTFKLQGMEMFLTAVSVEKGKVSNKEFEVPSDYKEMTPEQLRQMFGGY